MMKNLIATLFLAALVSVSAAQTSHLKFKGIPIEGTLNSFVQQLRAKGFSYIGTQDGIAVLNGEFAATKGCTVGVTRFSDRDQVNQVVVVFPKKDTWSGISQSYFSLKELLTEKYGTPESSETFSNYVPSSDNSKFYAILEDECHYISVFTAEDGKVQLTMKRQPDEGYSDIYTKAAVVLKYIDNANADETRKKVMDDL